MIKIIISIFIITFFSSCSFKSKPDVWKYRSIDTFSSYTKNFLSNQDAMARSDLKRAIKHAKQSANLTQLARIYLGECALNISVGIDSECSSYMEISSLVDDKSLHSYYSFISSSMQSKDIENLDDRYKDFAQNMLDKNYEKAKEDMLEMEKVISKLLSASLMVDELSFEEVSLMVDDASFYGYKKSVLFWLNIQKTKTTQESKKQKIDKKIEILNSLSR